MLGKKRVGREEQTGAGSRRPGILSVEQVSNLKLKKKKERKRQAPQQWIQSIRAGL